MKQYNYLVYFLLFSLIGCLGYLTSKDIYLFKRFEYDYSIYNSFERASLIVMAHYSRDSTIFSATFKLISVAIIILFAIKRNKVYFILYNSIVIPLLIRAIFIEGPNIFRSHGHFPFIDDINIILFFLTIAIYFVLSKINLDIIMTMKDFFWQVMGILIVNTMNVFIINWFSF